MKSVSLMDFAVSGDLEVLKVLQRPVILNKKKKKINVSFYVCVIFIEFAL